MALVGEVYINFDSGEISGNCAGCSAAEVADALAQIVGELQAMDNTPGYVDYDEGKFFSG
jgi:hypothetical protein